MNVYDFDYELLDEDLSILEESNIERTYVKSSNIVSFWYNDLAIVPGKGTLFVEFKTGAVYKFARVPNNIAEGFEKADSYGKYFWRFIRGKYPYQQVKKSFRDIRNKKEMEPEVTDEPEEKPIRKRFKRPTLSLNKKNSET